MEIFFSNRIEKLYHQLKYGLFFKDFQHPFAKRLIIVPSPAIKSWLKLEMAKDPDLNVSLGVEIIHLDQAIEKLTQKVSPKRKIPCALELSLMIEIEIKKMIMEGSDKWIDLRKFLQIPEKNDVSISLKTERRIFSLSEKLAALFLQYGTYGGEMVSGWEKDEKNENFQSENFQIALWKTIFIKNKWPYLIDEFKKFSINNSLQDVQVHLFSMSFLSKIHYELLSEISESCDVNYYLLSPCQAFWSDIQSDKEHYYQKKHVNRMQGMELDVYLRDQNSLLANFGKLGKEMAKLIEESNALTDSHYVLSAGVLEKGQYEDFDLGDFEAEAGSFSLLKAIQADLTLLRNPAEGEKLELDASDSSIQVHIASSPMREVQILYDQLLQIISKENITPSDVIVMAPDIMDYEPFIKSVFGSNESQLDFHVMDLELPSQNRLVQEFNHLLNLPSSRFSLEALMDFLSGIYFQKAHGFSLEDLDKIRKWLTKADLRWGISAADRNEILKQDHCQAPQVENREYGTLDYCIEKLLASLVIDGYDDELLNSQFERFAIDGLQASDAPLLGKITKILASLKEDLKLLSLKKKMNLTDWASYFECLVKAYFGVDETNENTKDEDLLLASQFDELRKVSLRFKSEQFSFYSVKSQLEKAFKKEKLDFQESHLNSVRFCSMLPMRAIPSKVIVLLGMNEGAFPRMDVKNALDLRIKSVSDYCPSKTDYDRYLFLETLLSAREYFIVSYVGEGSSGSLILNEFINYLDEGYLIGNQKFSELGIKKHPFHAFDRRYFEKNSGFTSYSFINHSLAHQFYKREKEKRVPFFPHFTMKDEPESQEIPELVLDMKELANFARNPLKTYFNKTLGIYLKTDEFEMKADEDFLISHLELSGIKKMSLRSPLDQVFDYVEKKGMMPSGLFKSIATEKIESEVAALRQNLSKHSIEAEELFSIDFSENHEEPCRLENGNWQLPCLKINYKDKLQIKIVGHFAEVCEKGLVLHAKDDKIDSIKIWPQFLVFSCLMDIYRIAEKQLIFLKCGGLKSAFFEDPFKPLEDYLSYYFKGTKNVSPLIPEWVYDFVSQDEKSLNEKIEKSLNNDFSPIFNNYLQWIYSRDDVPNCSSFVCEWKNEAQNLFSELYREWYLKK